MSLARESLERIIVERGDLDVAERLVSGAGFGETLGRPRRAMDLLDDRVVEHAPGEFVGLFVRQPGDVVAHARRHRDREVRSQPEQIAHRLGHRRGRRVHHARERRDLHNLAARLGGHRAQQAGLAGRIGQQTVEDAIAGLFIEIGLDEVDLGRADLGGVHVELLRRPDERVRTRVADRGQTADLEASNGDNGMGDRVGRQWRPLLAEIGIALR